MIVSDTAVKNRVSVMILALIILVMGVYCYQEIPREDEPDVTIPHVFVSTPYKAWLRRILKPPSPPRSRKN